VIARLAALALAACALVVAVLALRGDDRCAQLKADAQTAPIGQLGAIAADVDRCGDPRDRVVVAVRELGRGRRDAAEQIARKMTVDFRDDYLGWLAVWNLERSPAALHRAHELNPRGTPATR
jgi:hypothetical protein